MLLNSRVVRKGQGQNPVGTVERIVATNEEGYPVMVEVRWQWLGRRPTKARAYTTTKVTALEYATISADCGWLSPEGEYLECGDDTLHQELALKINQERYPEEWLQEPPNYAFEQMFLLERGWVRLDFRGAQIAQGRMPTPEQAAWLAKIPGGQLSTVLYGTILNLRRQGIRFHEPRETAS